MAILLRILALSVYCPLLAVGIGLTTTGPSDLPARVTQAPEIGRAALRGRQTPTSDTCGFQGETGGKRSSSLHFIQSPLISIGSAFACPPGQCTFSNFGFDEIAIGCCQSQSCELPTSCVAAVDEDPQATVSPDVLTW